MGLWDRLLGRGNPTSYEPAQIVQPAPYEPFISTAGIPIADPGTPVEWFILDAHRAGVEGFWKAQPNLRKVVDFVARNVASIPLEAYERVSDTDRRRLRGEPVADCLRTPRPGVGSYRFWHGVLSDGLLYDRWAVLWGYGPRGSVELTQVPAWRLNFQMDPLNRVISVRYWAGDRDDDGDRWIDLPLDRLIFDHGYAPRSAGLSPVQTLRDVLDEAKEAVTWRRELWENGTRAPGYITRAAGLEWKDGQRDRFVAAMRSTYGRDGSNRGGLPLLEDGMELKSTDIFSPRDTLDIEGRQLSAIEVSSAFHVAPELVGARQGNYSNIDAFRQNLYRDSLGPYITAWQDAINAQLVPALTDGRDVYVEAKVEVKLRGSFMEQAAVMQSATGAPWMTRNEARAMQNRPPVQHGDELVVPLNVLVGGQASPRDSGSQNRGKAVAVPFSGMVFPSEPARIVPKKSRAPRSHEDKVAEVVRSFFKRQERVIRTVLGAKAEADWWDEQRWNAELGDDLYRLAVMVSSSVAKSTLDSIGFSPDEFDEDRTLAWLEEVSRRSASSINDTTRAKIAAALESDDAADALDSTFAAQGSRALEVAVSTVTLLSGFAAVEAAQQVAPERATKTWVVTSSNPRASHAAMDGETVPLSSDFSNGMAWPGDAAGGADEVAGCNCSLVIDVA